MKRRKKDKLVFWLFVNVMILDVLMILYSYEASQFFDDVKNLIISFLKLFANAH